MSSPTIEWATFTGGHLDGEVRPIRTDLGGWPQRYHVIVWDEMYEYRGDATYELVVEDSR